MTCQLETPPERHAWRAAPPRRRRYPIPRACAMLLVAASTLAVRSATLAAQGVAGSAGQGDSAAAYDVVIRGGRVLDGAGNPWIAADVAILHGRVAQVGKIDGRGRTEIDARGKYVSPGWIDMMDQSGEAFLENGRAETKLQEGVTTPIAGEDGPPVHVDSLAPYFRRLERQGLSVNYGTYVSEGQIRVAVLGQVARAPTPAELDTMRALMAAAMQQGALGVTTGDERPGSGWQVAEQQGAGGRERVAGTNTKGQSLCAETGLRVSRHPLPATRSLLSRHLPPATAISSPPPARRTTPVPAAGADSPRRAGISR